MVSTLSGRVILVTLFVCGSATAWPYKKLSVVKPTVVGLPVAINGHMASPFYIGQPIDASGVVYSSSYYPPGQYPTTQVTYQPSHFGVQYPHYNWINKPAYQPSVPAIPTNAAGGSVGDPYNPKRDVEYIY